MCPHVHKDSHVFIPLLDSEQRCEGPVVCVCVCVCVFVCICGVAECLLNIVQPFLNEAVRSLLPLRATPTLFFSRHD